MTPVVLDREKHPFQKPLFALAYQSAQFRWLLLQDGLTGDFRDPRSRFAPPVGSRREGFFSGAVLCASFWTFSGSS